MNELRLHLNRPTSLIHSWSNRSLSWSEILIAEDADVEHGEVTFIPRSTLATPEEYAARFDAHLDAGYSWINMNAAGIIDETLLVIIELPDYSNTTPRGKASVNLSGPNMKDGEIQWDVTNYIKIIG